MKRMLKRIINEVQSKKGIDVWISFSGLNQKMRRYIISILKHEGLKVDRDQDSPHPGGFKHFPPGGQFSYINVTLYKPDKPEPTKDEVLYKGKDYDSSVKEVNEIEDE